MAYLQVGLYLTEAREVTVEDHVPFPGIFAEELVWQMWSCKLIKYEQANTTMRCSPAKSTLGTVKSEMDPTLPATQRRVCSEQSVEVTCFLQLFHPGLHQRLLLRVCCDWLGFALL